MKPSGELFLERKQPKRLGVYVREATRKARVRGARPGGGRTSTLVGSPGLSWSNFDTPWASSGPKISSVKFQVNWTPFGFPFLQYSKTR